MWKANVSWVMSVSPSVHGEQLGFHWTDFHEIWYLSIFRKSVKKFQVSLKLDKNNGYFTWIPIYIFYHILLKSSSNGKCVRKYHRDNQNTHFMFNNFFQNLCHLWDNVEKYCRDGQATDDSMVYAHCMLDTWGYKYTLRLCNTYCFSTVVMVARTCLTVTWYIHHLSCLFQCDSMWRG